jgi:Mg-chelatase subunit ChlD
VALGAVVAATVATSGVSVASGTEPTGGQAEERVVVRGVDTSQFPQVTVEVQIAGPDPGRAAFSIREDGRLVSIDRVVVADRSGEAAAVVIAIDRSGSMEGTPIEQARIAAGGFVERAGSGDRIGLVTFDTEPEMLAEVGTDPAELQRLIDGIGHRHRTALWDAISLSASMLADDPLEDRYILVVSDVDAGSYDNASQGSAQDAIEAARAAGASVLAVGLPAGPVDDRELRRVTAETGGLLLLTSDPRRLDDLFGQLQAALRTSYRLHYSSQATGPEVAAQLTVGASRVEFSYEVPGPEDDPAGPGDIAGAEGRLPLLALVVLALLAAGAVAAVVARRRR